MPVKIPKRRETATTFESLQARGIKTIELETPSLRQCKACGHAFLGSFMPEIQTICPDCVAERVRFSETEVRQSRAEEKRRRAAAMGLTGKLLAMTFDTFQDHEQPEAFRQSRQFVGVWPSIQALAFLGERGTGKTHLCAAMLHALAESGEYGRYVHIPSLATDLAMAPDWQQAATSLFVPLFTTGLLILDDCGRERTRPDSAWPQMLDSLIDRRTVGGYPTVMAANMTRDELARWLGDAGASRFLSSAHLVEMRPGDRRFSLPTVKAVAVEDRNRLESCKTCQGAGWVLDGRHRAAHPDRLLKCPTCQGAGY